MYGAVVTILEPQVGVLIRVLTNHVEKIGHTSGHEAVINFVQAVVGSDAVCQCFLQY